MIEREYLAAVAAYSPIGCRRLNLLISFFGNAKNIWHLKSGEFLEIGFSESFVRGFAKHRESFDQSGYFKKLEKLRINYLTVNDDDYPDNLKGLDDAPPVLYYKGKILKSDGKSVALVGARKSTEYGRKVCGDFSADFVKSGLTVVSGLARGIDTVAHERALKEGGRTIAVLGSGLDLLYPWENKYLAEKIEKSGALISEYPLEYPLKPANFAARNRIISGISLATVVVEGAARSGTLLTASRAAEQGRNVYAIPGRIDSPMSSAPHFLIRNGACLVTSASQVLEEIDSAS